MKELLKSVVIAALWLSAVLGVIVFAGMFKHVFMSLCFLVIFACIVGVVHSLRTEGSKDDIW